MNTMVFYGLLIVFIVINFIKHKARLKKLRIQRDKNNVEIKKILDKTEIQCLGMAKDWENIEKDFIAISKDINKVIYGK